jgi:hypothetical protein
VAEAFFDIGFGPVEIGHWISNVAEHFVALLDKDAARPAFLFTDAKSRTPDPSISFRLTTPTVYGCQQQAQRWLRGGNG